MDWAGQEMRTVNLGDKRLNKRLITLLNSLGEPPQPNIPAACGGWAETKAAYRFFDNAQVNAEKILAPHRAASLERIREQNTVLLIQDTTTLNFSGQHQREDIGPLNSEHHRGILLHPTLAVTPERLCLGVLDTYHWLRESLHKWLLGYKKAQEIAQLAPETRIVTVADREADIYDLYHEAYISTQTSTAYWLIRAMTNRRLLDSQNKLQSLKLIETIKNTMPVGIIEFEYPGRNKAECRNVKQAVYIGKVRLNPPDRKRKKTQYQIIETNVVIVSEIDTPKDQTPLEWILLTNVPVIDAASGYEIVK